MQSYAHDAYTEFMIKHDFEVTKHFHLETAWQATFTHGNGGHTIGINSEVCLCTIQRGFLLTDLLEWSRWMP